MKTLLAAALALAVLPARAADVGFPVANTFNLNVAGLSSSQLVVEFGPRGKICGPIRLRDESGRVVVQLAAGHCVPR